MTEATHVYIGRCPKCNAVPFVVVDNPDYPKRTAREVAAEIRIGSIVERINLKDFRAMNMSRCNCPKAPAKAVAR